MPQNFLSWPYLNILFSAVLFPEFGGGSLDSQDSFVVLYGGYDGVFREDLAIDIQAILNINHVIEALSGKYYCPTP